MRTFGYGLKQGMKNIGQNKIFSLAAIGTITTCLFLLGLFYILLSNFQNMMYNAEGNVGVTVFFDADIEAARIDEMAALLRKREEVRDLKYISGHAGGACPCHLLCSCRLRFFGTLPDASARISCSKTFSRSNTLP